MLAHLKNADSSFFTYRVAQRDQNWEKVKKISANWLVVSSKNHVTGVLHVNVVDKGGG